MRIGIDIRMIGKKRTGDEAVFFNLVKNLAKIDEKNEYLLFTDVREEKTLAEIGNQLGIVGKNNFEIISLSSKNRFDWNFRTLPTYLRKHPLDVFHTQYITPWFVPKSVKIVTTVHDISWNFFPKLIKFSDLFFLKILIPLSLERADKIIAVSEFTRDEIIKFYKTDQEKVECVPNSIGDDFLKAEISEEKLNNVRKKYALPEKFVLYVGTLQPRKNIPMLIEAYVKMKNQLNGIGLVICGNKKAHNYDKKIDEILAINKVENEIIFPGFIDEEDKVAVFRLAHVFAFPSLYEGFGVPILEAMSQNVPVLASDNPALKEIGQNGALYFITSSLDDFSKKLYDVSMDSGLRRELTINGKTRVSSFSWENSAKKTLAIYEKIFHNYN